MNQIYPDNGLLTWLTRMVAADVRFHLFVNNVTPTKAFTLASLTEAAWSGYAGINVLAAAFTLSGVAGNVGSLLAAPIAFTNSSGSTQSAYGYYITEKTPATLLAVALFDSAPISKVNGDSWLITPVIGDFSQF